MLYRYLPAIPDRMVVLSILPPPLPGKPPAPFGWGALMVTAGRRGEASFASKSHGYGAGYPPRRFQSDLRRLFRPDDAALLYLPVPEFNYYHRGGRLIMPRSHRDLLPKTGSRNVSVVAIPLHALEHAAALAGVILPGPFPTPLARLHRIGAEAQAAWVYWLWQRSASRLRNHLLASFAAWQVAERCKAPSPP